MNNLEECMKNIKDNSINNNIIMTIIVILKMLLEILNLNWMKLIIL